MLSNPSTETGALLVIDMQTGLVTGRRLANAEVLLENVAFCVRAARDGGATVIWIQDDAGPALWSPENPGWRIHADFSVRATLSRALLLGHGVALVADAHSTFDNAFRPATGEIALLNEEVESASRRGLPLQLVTTEELPAWLADDLPLGIRRQASRSGESAGGDAG